MLEEARIPLLHALAFLGETANPSPVLFAHSDLFLSASEFQLVSSLAVGCLLEQCGRASTSPRLIDSLMQIIWRLLADVRRVERAVVLELLPLFHRISLGPRSASHDLKVMLCLRQIVPLAVEEESIDAKDRIALKQRVTPFVWSLASSAISCFIEQKAAGRQKQTDGIAEIAIAWEVAFAVAESPNHQPQFVVLVLALYCDFLLSYSSSTDTDFQGEEDHVMMESLSHLRQFLTRLVPSAATAYALKAFSFSVLAHFASSPSASDRVIEHVSVAMSLVFTISVPWLFDASLFEAYANFLTMMLARSMTQSLAALQCARSCCNLAFHEETRRFGLLAMRRFLPVVCLEMRRQVAAAPAASWIDEAIRLLTLPVLLPGLDSLEDVKTRIAALILCALGDTPRSFSGFPDAPLSEQDPSPVPWLREKIRLVLAGLLPSGSSPSLSRGAQVQL